MLDRFTKRRVVDGKSYIWDSVLSKWVLLTAILKHDSYSAYESDDFKHLEVIIDGDFKHDNVIESHDDFADAFQGGGSGGGGAEGSFEPDTSPSSDSCSDCGSSDSGSFD